jgi:hypothetical protein
MKIKAVSANNRKKVFEVSTHKGSYELPYAVADPSPGYGNRVDQVSVDEELGNEGFTFELESGETGSIHVDDVLEYNRDPSYMADLLLYKLTLEAERRFEESELSHREAARRLQTSPSQLYRLLDPTNYRKSIRQMCELLWVLGYEVSFELRDRLGRRSA